MKYIALLAGLAATTTALTIQTRQSEEMCGQWDTSEQGKYIVYNNLWGQDNADEGGSQCTTVNSLGEDGTLAWSTAWTWTGGQGQVKSYANAALVFDPVQISALSGIPTSISWSYEGEGLIANVAYDIFLASTAGAEAAEYEIMVWLGALGGAGPISETGSPIGTAEVAGQTWDLYNGPNGQMSVYSFVATGGDGVSEFSGDLKEFLDYVVAEQGVSAEQFVNDVQTGTEPFEGTGAVFTVASYNVDVQ